MNDLIFYCNKSVYDTNFLDKNFIRMIIIFFFLQFFGKDQDYENMMKKIKNSGDDVKTINMVNSKMSKQVLPLKILIDDDSEIRATNFHGTTKTGKTYISPQVVFVRATGRQKSIDISFPIHQLQQIIDSLQTIKNENDDYFEEL